MVVHGVISVVSSSLLLGLAFNERVMRFWKETTSVSAKRGSLRSGIRSMAPTRLNTYLVLVLLRDESRAYDVR